jgi:hypothetical protein
MMMMMMADVSVICFFLLLSTFRCMFWHATLQGGACLKADGSTT